MNATAKEYVQGAARVGRGGKLHPALRYTDGHISIICSCPGARNGSAHNRAQFFEGVQRTCRASSHPPVAKRD